MTRRPASNSSLLRSIHFRIVTAYALIGLVWIFFSSVALNLFVTDASLRQRYEVFKGFAFVIITSILLGWILGRYLARISKNEGHLLQLNRLYSFLSQVNQTIVRCQSKEELFGEACRTAVQFGGFRMAWIGRVDTDMRKIVPVAHYGVEEGCLFNINVSITANPAIRGPAAVAAMEGILDYCNDITGDNRMTGWQQEAERFGYHSFASVPITTSGKVAFVFTIYAKEPNFFTYEETRLLTEISRDLSYALDHFEEEKRREEAEEELQKSEAILRLILDTLPVGVWMADRTGKIVMGNRLGQQIWGGAKLLAIKDFGEYRGWWSDSGKRIEPEEWAMARAISRGESSFNEMIDIECFDGSKKTILHSAAPLRDEKGEIIGGLVVNEDITKLRQAEKALLQQERQYRTLFDASPHPMWVYDSETLGFLMVNEAAVLEYGYSREEFLEMTIKDIRPPEDVPALLENISLEVNGINRAGIWRHLRKDGSLIFVEITGHPADLMGRKCEVILANNVTWRIENEALLAGQKETLESIVSGAPLTEVLNHLIKFIESASSGAICSILILDEEGKKLQWEAAPNLPAEYIHEIDRLQVGPTNESCGTAVYRREQVIVSDIATDPLWKEHARLALKHGLQACTSSPIFGGNGQVLGTFAFYYAKPRKPTPYELRLIESSSALAGIAIERRREEQTLQEINESLRSLNNIVTACTDVRDLQRLLETVLDEVTAITSLDGGSICIINDNDCLQLVAGRKLSVEVTRELSENQIKVGECLCGTCAADRKPLILPDRQAVLRYSSREALRNDPINFHAAFPLLVTGRCVGVLCLFTRETRSPNLDKLKLLETVTAQIAIAIESARLYQQTLRQAVDLEQTVAERTKELEQANRELESFSFSVSHDLRAPLVIIDGYCTALLEDHYKELSTQAQAYVERLQKASKRMSQMIEAMLNLSRFARGTLRREIVDLSEMAREISGELTKTNPERNVEFRIQEDVTIKADSRLIRVVMENVIGNAWKYSSKKQTSLIEFGQICSEEKNLYFVRDNGAGFDMEYADKLFSPFHRLHRQEDFEGSGIGLATVQRIIRRHGGTIWVEAAVDKGATFYFTIDAP